MKVQLSPNRHICSGDCFNYSDEPLIRVGAHDAVFTRGKYQGKWISQIQDISYLEFILYQKKGRLGGKTKRLLRERLHRLMPSNLHYLKVTNRLSRKQRKKLEKANKLRRELWQQRQKANGTCVPPEESVGDAKAA